VRSRGIVRLIWGAQRGRRWNHNQQIGGGGCNGNGAGAATISNTSPLTGGNGGNGEDGGIPGNGGGGGAGGYGAIVTGTGDSSNTSTITSGNGGDGGVGVQFTVSSATFTNSGTVTGGGWSR
jgi:hypothetical protein